MLLVIPKSTAFGSAGIGIGRVGYDAFVAASPAVLPPGPSAFWARAELAKPAANTDAARIS